MKIKLIYPRWPKLKNQPEFHLPPHGPVVLAAALPKETEIDFCDENVQKLEFGLDYDMIFVSCMLSCQLPRGFEIMDAYRELGKIVIAGGIAVALHAEEVQQHATSVFLGEAEGRIDRVLEDYELNQLKPVYDFMRDLPDIAGVGAARRSILDHERYNFRGVQMVDLVHASRGCRYNCFPCCVGFLGGRQFRARPIDKVIEEVAGIDNQRLFFVDNTFAHNKQWLRDLFTELAPLKKKWISHPIMDDPEIMDLAAAAGCWYVYQAVINTDPRIAGRITRLKERGIGVEGTIILGTDDHDEQAIKELVDFLLALDLNLAEFTVLTPFQHTPIRQTLQSQGRILHSDWSRYTCDQTVFQPAKLTPEKLDELYQYAWDTFYADCSMEVRMAQLYMKVIEREKGDGTYRRTRLRREKWTHSAGGVA